MPNTLYLDYARSDEYKNQEKLRKDLMDLQYKQLAIFKGEAPVPQSLSNEEAVSKFSTIFTKFYENLNALDQDMSRDLPNEDEDENEGDNELEIDVPLVDLEKYNAMMLLYNAPSINKVDKNKFKSLLKTLIEPLKNIKLQSVNYLQEYYRGFIRIQPTDEKALFYNIVLIDLMIFSIEYNDLRFLTQNDIKGKEIEINKEFSLYAQAMRPVRPYRGEYLEEGDIRPVESEALPPQSRFFPYRPQRLPWEEPPSQIPSLESSFVEPMRSEIVSRTGRPTGRQGLPEFAEPLSEARRRVRQREEPPSELPSLEGSFVDPLTGEGKKKVSSKVSPIDKSIYGMIKKATNPIKVAEEIFTTPILNTQQEQLTQLQALQPSIMDRGQGEIPQLSIPSKVDVKDTPQLLPVDFKSISKPLVGEGKSLLKKPKSKISFDKSRDQEEIQMDLQPTSSSFAKMKEGGKLKKYKLTTDEVNNGKEIEYDVFLTNVKHNRGGIF